MKLVIGREILTEPLQAVITVVERRQTLPILANVMVAAGEGTLTFTATDMEVELQVTIPHDAKAGGSTALPARKLADICKSLPAEAVLEVETKGDKAVVKSGRSRFSLIAMDAEEFPSLGAIEGKAKFTIPGAVLRELVELTQFAMAQQDVRYYLNGMLLEITRERLRAVATDGHRLAMSERPVAIDIAEPLQVVVPRKGVVELARILGDENGEIVVAVSDNHIQIESGKTRFTSKLIDGRFPDYERVLPRDTDKVVVADRDRLRQGLARTSILSNEKFRGVRLNLESDLLKALAHNPEQEEAEEEIEVQYAGPELEIGFNVSYLLDALSVMPSEQVSLHFSDANSSCLLRPDGDEGSRYVVMPMRL